MPFASKAQRRFFYAAEARGQMPKGTAARWQKETGKKKLPEHKKTAATIPDLSRHPQWMQDIAAGKNVKNVYFSRHKDGSRVPVVRKRSGDSSVPIMARKRFFGLATQHAELSPQEERAVMNHWNRLQKTAAPKLVGMTYDPNNPKIRLMQARHGSSWKNNLAQKRGIDPKSIREKTAAWSAGVATGLEKVSAAVVELSEAPSSVEAMAIKDKGERRRYLADMSARNVRGAMKRPSSVRSAVVTQGKTAGFMGDVKAFFKMLAANPHKAQMDKAINHASQRTGKKPEKLTMEEILASYNQLSF